jgi:hypothetical protein
MNAKISERLEEYKTFAFPKALEISRSQKHVSLILDKKGNMLSFGQNAARTHPLAAQYGYRFNEVHSELDAYLKIPRSLRTSDLILVNYRFNRFGNLRMSRPCSKCLPWCKAIFRHIVYTTDEGFEYEETH